MSITLHTSLGDLKVELFCEEAPRCSRNFLGLAASGYYDGTIFHRNIKQFLVQGGDPTGTGKGGNDLEGGYFDDEIVSFLKHSKRGILSMANRGANTNGSQFFFTYAKHGHLDGQSSVFGHVIWGFQTLDAMERVQVDAKYRPLTPITLVSVTIHANPFAE